MDRARTEAQEIQLRSAQVIREYPALWRQMADAWREAGSEPRAWLMYSASYLLRTGAARWAIDPVRLQHRLPAALHVDYAADLEPLSLVLLTHQHKDHLDLPLIRSLSHLPATWVVPEVLLRRVRDEAALPLRQIVVPRPMQPVELEGIRITPFEGMHWERSTAGTTRPDRGVPSLGYLVEQAGRKWLFPGDVRRYAASELPPFGPVDILFAHVWLGRGAALQSPPPLLEEFCRWCIALRPDRVALAHLEEFGRGPEDCWSPSHAALVAERLRALCPEMAVTPLVMGSSIEL